MTNRVAIITGAGSGLGRAFAHALAGKGWSIAALGRTAATLRETNAPLGSGHLEVTCDISDPASVREAFDRVTNHFGRLDLLVNNAGVPGPTGSLETIDPDEFRRTVETNLAGTFYCTQRAFEWMKQHGGGRIINNGSIASHAPRAHAASYAASKAAVASLTVSTNLDGRPYHITATELDIGNASTELLGSFTGSEPMFDASHVAQLLAQVAELPLGVTVDQLTATASGMPYLGRG